MQVNYRAYETGLYCSHNAKIKTCTVLTKWWKLRFGHTHESNFKVHTMVVNCLSKITKENFTSDNGEISYLLSR